MQNWDKNFLDMAFHVSAWSKDPSTKVGAVVVSNRDRREIAHGYNGFPPGIDDTPARLANRKIKYKLMVHAERNALYNAPFDVVGGTLYCTMHPCLECAKTIISHRIRRVVTTPLPPIEKGRWTEEIPEAQIVLQEAGVLVDIVRDDGTRHRSSYYGCNYPLCSCGVEFPEGHLPTPTQCPRSAGSDEG